MIKLNLLVFIFVVAGNCIYYADGLQCFDCYYVNHNGNLRGDRSCESGTRPEFDFSRECSLKMAMSSAFLSQRGISFSNKTVSVGELLATRGISTEEINWSCTKVVMEGHEGSDSVKATIRGCFPTIDGDGCKEDTAGNWTDNSQNDAWAEYVASLSYDLDRTDPVTACMCTGERCNSALSSVSISVSVMIRSFAVAFLKNVHNFI